MFDQEACGAGLVRRRKGLYAPPDGLPGAVRESAPAADSESDSDSDSDSESDSESDSAPASASAPASDSTS